MYVAIEDKLSNPIDRTDGQFWYLASFAKLRITSGSI
jgi:hypothetical protein